MAKRERMFQPGLRGLDTNLLVVLSFIMIFGFVMIYSASYYTAGLSKAYNYDPMYLLKNQIVYTVLGVIAMLVVASVNYHIWSAFVIPGYVLCIGLILLLKTPLGVTVKGATRWIRLGGIQFQVAEPIKLIMIVFMATLIVMKGRHLKSWLSMIKIMIPSGIIAVLIWKISDNMSTATILLGTAVFMMYVVHPEQWKFMLCAAGVVIFVAVMVYYVKHLDPSALEANFRFAVSVPGWSPMNMKKIRHFSPCKGFMPLVPAASLEKALATVFRSWVKSRNPTTIIFLQLSVRNWASSEQV